ncbi:MAG TPA: hypothetical protein VG826_12550 [Pirellulales bacterium]|nr:hypothetical protein [Pirellulales bacterium]
MSRSILACLFVAVSLLAHGASAQQPAAARRWISAYEAQRLAGAPVTQPAVIRNFGPVDLGGGGTRVGNGDEPAVDTVLYGNYYNPSFMGYNSYGYGNYASYGGRPLGWTNYPPWLYRPRYFYPYRYYPLRTGFSVYNPYFYYNNTYYGGYASPFWTGYGGFGFPYHFGAFGAGGANYGAGGAGYTFGGFGYPYRYGVFGYPYPGLFSLPYAYMPSPAYFMYPGLGGLYTPPGFVGQPGYAGYAGYGLPVSPPAYTGGFYW